MFDPDFKRRVKMIEASEMGDLGLVDALLKEDGMLTAFSAYMAYLINHDKTEMFNACLNLPSLDKGSSQYDRMVLSLTLGAAAGDKKETLEILLSLSKDPQDSATRVLSHIFNSVRPGNLETMPDAEIGRLLIDRGADVNAAASLQEGQLAAQIRNMGKALREIRAYKKEITGHGASSKPANPSANCNRRK